jgi:hypothetical protein
LPLAVLALLDLSDALDALRDGHGCRSRRCHVCGWAEMYGYLVPMLTAAVEEPLVPFPALLRRRGVSADASQVLRLLDTGILPAGAAAR